MAKPASIFHALPLALLLAAGAPDLRAADGRIPISASGTIAQPGSYYLTRDLTSAAVTLTISAVNVTLDLAGYAVASTNNGSNVIAATDGASGLELFGGRITGGGTGVRVGVNGGARNIKLHDLKLTGQFNSAVEAGGFTTPTRNITLERLLIANTRVQGVVCWNCDGGLIRNNHLSAVAAGGGAGILLSSGGIGTRITGNLIRSFGEGIVVSAVTACLVTRNSIAGATTNGIDVNAASRNQVRDNLVINGAAGGFGINVNNGNQNTIEGNSTMNDGGYGISITGAGNVYARNRSQGNGANYFIAPGNVNGGGNF